MKVKDVMTARVVKVSADEPVRRAAELMKEWNVGAVPVEKNGKFAGIVTDRDIILRCIAAGRPDTVKAEEVMTDGKLVCISPEHSVTEAARLMAKEKVRRLPVCDSGKIVGILSLSDIAGAEKMFYETASAFCEICRGREE